MNRTSGLNVAAFGGAVALSTLVAWLPDSRSKDSQGTPFSTVVATSPGAPAALRDAAGHLVSLRAYRRIASASTVADELLLALCEPDRIAAFTPYTDCPRAFRFSGKPTVHLHDLESILVLQPDLVLVSGNGDMQPIARLREAGVTVFDLGEIRGLGTLVPNLHQVAALVGHPERGELLARELAAGLDSVAADVPGPSRRRGMYVSAYGGRLFGGAAGTSYHDVLVAAGLVDAAAGYRDWPSYGPDELLELDPDVIVTDAGMRDRICGHAGLGLLRACTSARGVVEVEGALLSDPGLDMVDAAQAVRVAVYGPPEAAGVTPTR